MAQEAAPAYQWYVKDWRSSRAVQRMSFSERGVFREMLDEQWEAGSLPDDPHEVAALIATSPAQEAEVISAWPVVRRKFASVEDMPGRIQSIRLERIRKERRKYEQWSKKNARKGGLARAQSATRSKGGTYAPAERPAERPQNDQPGTQPGTQPRNQPANQRQPASSSSSSSSSSSASAYRHARATGLCGDHLAHRSHVACDETFSRCVPSAVHDKLAGLLAPKHGGDQLAAKVALSAWYPTVWASLAPDFVMGDAFRFWQGRFDVTFASKDRPPIPEPNREAEADAVREILRRQGALS